LLYCVNLAYFPVFKSWCFFSAKIITAFDADPDYKSRVTLQHFPEIDDCDVFYALLPGGYIGCSVTIELAYAYAKGKEIVVSEAPTEFAVRALVSEISNPDQFLTRFTRG